MTGATTYLKDELNQKTPPKIIHYFRITDIEKDAPVLAVLGSVSFLGGVQSSILATNDTLHEIIFILVGKLCEAANFLQNHLFQKIQPNVMGGCAFSVSGVMIAAAKKLDVVIPLIEMIVKIATALRAFQQTGEDTSFAADRRLFPAGATA